MDLTDHFCQFDDFVKRPDGRLLLANPARRRNRSSSMSVSEIMTILVYFHHSHYRTFKHFYLQCLVPHHRTDFPGLPSYNRFVECIGSGLSSLCAFLHAHLGQLTGLAFVDATSIDVCDTHRIAAHRVFRGTAQRGKTSTGWFFGFKLHIIVNDRGELLAVKLTPGNVDDRKPVPEMAQALTGKLFGDKGYISQPLFNKLWEHGLQLVTKIKKNMKNKLMTLFDKVMLRKRALIESVNDILKNQCQIEHSRHRSSTNFMTHLVAGLVAYTLLPKLPSFNIIHGKDITL
ncbi:MAG: IS982 family transposase [Pseudomonadota bacterium]